MLGQLSKPPVSAAALHRCPQPIWMLSSCPYDGFSPSMDMPLQAQSPVEMSDACEEAKDSRQQDQTQVFLRTVAHLLPSELSQPLIPLCQERERQKAVA